MTTVVTNPAPSLTSPKTVQARDSGPATGVMGGCGKMVELPALGWAVPAACGAKLAKPDRPIVAILGDGAMLFGGMQPLWSIAPHKAPVTVIVVKNCNLQ